MKYKLTDKWPEPLRGKDAIAWQAGKYIIEVDGYRLFYPRRFIESNPDLFEPVRDVEFNAYLLSDSYGEHYADRATLYWKNNSGKQITTDEIIEALNKHFNE